jgi:hypothetical protein
VTLDRDERAFWFKAAGFAVFIAIGTASLIYLSDCRAKQGWHDLPGEPKRAFVRGDKLVLVDHLRSSVGRTGGTAEVGDRLTALQLATGKPVAEKIFDGGAQCWPARGDHIWCATDKELFALDAWLATIGDAYVIAGKLGTPVPGKYEATQGDVVLVLPDGHGVRVDGATLAARLDDAKAPTDPDDDRCHTSLDAKIKNDDYLRLGDGPRFGLARADHNYGSVTVPADAPVFLRAGQAAPEFWRVPELYLIRHDTTIDPETAQPQLSRVDVDRHVTWTATVSHGDCELVTRVGHTLVIAFGDPELRAETIDVDTGAIGWRYGR